ncbi:MAG TPA: S9 family peptidase [Pyrinomonadaceae bacterium]|jgi:dipeptidyl aminopeptidase/acylaminoacyl peptidase|nr:S9 family peptidase [Pyrinomonadaceae bacterium]
MKSLAAALSLVVVLAATVTAQTWEPEMHLKFKAVGTPRVSPDGKRVVYTVNEAVMTADKSEFVTQIWMADLATKQKVQLTFGDKSSTNPKWSPDGNWIAFTSNRKDNRNNLYLLSLNGGEAEPLTDGKSAVINFAWSPDGRSLAFTMSDPKTDDEEKNDKGKNDWRWIDENLKLARLYVLPVNKDANGKREPRKLTTGNYQVEDFDWSSDGSRIAFGHVKSPGANDWTTSDVSIVDVASGNITALANTPAAETAPLYSPDGKSIAILASDAPPRWAQSGVIQILPASGGQPKTLMASFDAQPGIAGWSSDGKRLYFSEPKGTGTQIYSLDVAANRIDELKVTPAVISAFSLNRSGTTFGFVRQTSDTPADVYIASATDFTPVQITTVNADLKTPPVGRTEVITWKSKDGKQIEGLLTYPVSYQTGQRVPLILNIHGGPAGVFQQTFLGGRGVYPLATFSSRGYAILRPNPRGSSGYGTEFRRANLRDWGFGDFQDLMTGVDRVIEMGVADPARLGVMGWSYGGFMTSWVVTQTNRFKAASAGAPVTNLMSFNGTADIPSFIPDYFGGQFWEVMELYQKHSPMFNVKAVTTPTMIQHGEADVRVPISQGYEFYNALKVKGVPTRMLVLPRQPHGPNEPKMQLAAMKANLEWFEKYIGSKAETSRN